MNLTAIEINFKGDALRKGRHPSNREKESPKDKHIFNDLYLLYKNSNYPIEAQRKNLSARLSFIEPPKFSNLPIQKQKKMIDKALFFMKNNHNRSESASVIKRDCSFSLHPIFSRELSKENRNEHQARSSRNSKVILQIGRQNKGDIPFLLPASVTYMNHYNSLSEKSRHKRLIDLFNKLKFLIENNPHKRNDYLREFLLKNGIYNDSMFTEEKLHNLKDFIFSNMHNVNPSKQIKEIIKEGLSYSKAQGESSLRHKDDLYYTLSRTIEHCKKAPIRSHTPSESARLSKGKIDLFKHMDLIKQRKILKDSEAVMQISSNSAIINELEKDISDAVRVREKKFKEMNRILMSSFSFITSHVIPNENKAKSSNRTTRQRVVQPFMLTLSRTRSRLGHNHPMDKTSFNHSVYAQKSSLNQVRSYSTSQINQRMYYAHVTKNKKLNEMKSIRKAMKLTEYILCKQKKNQQSIEKAMKALHIDDFI